MCYESKKRKVIDLNSTQWDRIEKIKEYQDFLDKKIKESKEKGKTEVFISEQPYSLWLKDMPMAQDWAAVSVLGTLHQKGFKTEYRKVTSAKNITILEQLRISWDDDLLTNE